jgi:uncharacterized GH25 family protein
VLEVTVQDASSSRPIRGATVNAFQLNVASSSSTSAVTSDEGVARLRLSPGEYQTMVNKSGYSTDQSQNSVERGTTNRLTISLKAAPTLTGTVMDPAGKPAPKVQVVLFPGGGAGSKSTDSDGHFSMVLDQRSFSLQEYEHLAIARDLEHNLAAVAVIDEDSTNLTLRLEPALTLAGRVLDPEGKAIPNATVQIVFWTERVGSTLNQPTRGDAEGRFEVKALPPNRRYGFTVSAKGFGQETRDVQASDALAGRVDLDSFELLVANQRIAGIVVDENDKPVSGASINSYGQYGRSKQPNVNGRTDAKGRFSFDQLCEGPISLSVNGPDNSYASTTVEAGDTNITIQLQPRSANVRRVSSRGSSKLTGAITDPDGKPAANVTLDIFPVNSSQGKKTDAQGRFTFTYDSSAYTGISGLVPVLVARDFERNLAAAQDLEEGTTNVSLRLEPGLTLTGAVTSEDGKVITNAEVELIIRIPRISGSLGSPVRADPAGHFELKALPVDRQFSVSVSAKGYGREQRTVAETEPDTRRVALDTFQLPLANLRVAGVVVDSDDKPVSGASVSLYGPKQPSAATQTDSKGRFAFSGVCAGPVQFSFSNPRGDYGNATAEGGDTNITLRATRSRSSSTSTEARPVPLKGKPLPDLAPLGLAATDSPSGHPVLALLIDAEQRPSRRTLKVLSDQADTLKQKGIAVVVLQAGTMSADAFADWKKETATPFPVGAFKTDPEKARAAWGAIALPWLILTDKSHRVTAEGFDAEELDAKLQALSKP